ncbi:phospholipase D-like domain-containing protein [Brevibacillus laterosporus]|uniref:phospholipase D-like domain-containing protein n=1 Tax=Brevibacillus laterosporus TaxID=1465 RepID=UPI001140327C|nr:phospholipase D-like domain-containing protein [Brevibacillus laterosporus]
MSSVSLTRLHVLSEILIGHLNNKSLHYTGEIKREIMKCFPNITQDELENFLLLQEIQSDSLRASQLTAEIVATVPLDLDNDFRRTVGVLREHILKAEKSILITGYSISEFAFEIIDLLVQKSRDGVRVRFFLDKDVDVTVFKDRFKKQDTFKVYQYKTTQVNSALHAKVIILDKQSALISSSNLSYNGIINNIEIGSMIKGGHVFKLEALFDELLLKNYFEEII